MRRLTWLALAFEASLAIAAAACSSNPSDGAGAGWGNGDASAAADAGGPEDGATASDGSLATAEGDAVGSDGFADAGVAGRDAASQDATRQDSATQDASQDVAGENATGQDAPTGDATGSTMPMYVTFYGWADNSPPGNGIAYPTLHSAAGGTGTYADPITFATDPTEFARGTRLYVPFILKYVMMEDSCGQCATDWTTHKWHIDLWMNSNGSEQAPALINCEGSWTRSQTAVELNPPATRTVTTAPLFDPSTNACRTTP